MSTDLIAALRAALDGQERITRALTEPHDWHVGPGDDPTWEDESTVYLWPPEFHTPYEEDKHWRGLTTSGPALAAYIAAHDPAFVLADIAAKRTLIDLHHPERIEVINADGDERSGDWCATCDGDPYPCATLLLLAEAYGIRAEGPTT